ncbi:methionyl-tRNA formyltransferase [Bacteroidales bacterium OttesenSCG-928-M11]|nr:methionyl-tRNA formyltransferase [Bacteroidales bacterium OttesenSCG-928-M11]
MDKKDLKIVYLGTPEFAVEPLRVLVEEGYNVVGVVTMPDKPAGRGKKLQQSAVKEYALSQNLPLLQPEKLRDTTFLEALSQWQADVQIVVAFRMLPEVVWNMPRLGTFNLHASLLPDYRGAAPINRAIMAGETETGITTFFLTHEIDTGEIIFQEKIVINDTDNAGLVHDSLMNLGAKLVQKTVDALLDGSIRSIPQNQIQSNPDCLKLAPKIFKEDCRIDWTKTSKEIYDFIRGLAPYPAAFTEIELTEGELLYIKVFESNKLIEAHNQLPGTISSDGKTYLRIATADGWLELRTIQVAGKKSMPIEDFLRGRRTQ